MKKYFLLLSFSLFFHLSFSQKINPRHFLDLSGAWGFRLDADNKGIEEKWQTQEFSDFVNLPGTTDENKKGTLNINRGETTHLSREYSWLGKCWYQKRIKIDKSWEGKTIQLLMERTKPSQVWVDGRYSGSNSNITTPQLYDLSRFIIPGEHTITILVDNGKSVPEEIISSSHAYVDHTQTNWNGIIGKFGLEAVNSVYISDIQTYPDIDQHSVKIKMSILNRDTKSYNSSVDFDAVISNTPKNVSPVADKAKFFIIPGTNHFEFDLNLGKTVVLWEENMPAIYQLSLSLSLNGTVVDKKGSSFGLRKFSTSGTQFVINGHTTFLRGKHDACVFPLIAHAPMDTSTWDRYFKICKSWGINHVRFHSWCPPEAAFEAADKIGIYLQPEMPYWGKEDPKKTELIEFLRKEGLNIQKTYSNHPSFVMFALGNELSGDLDVMKDFLKSFRSVENRHLFAYGSNNYLGFKAPVEGEDYLTTCRIGGESKNTFDTHVRASFSFADAYDGGYINGSYPNTKMDYSVAIKKSVIPVISHETGQFQTYPDFNEINKYHGVLKPWNLEIFRKRLEDSGMGKQSNDFFRASGALSAICYKADIEMCLRTRGFGGFQLLDLQDFPGQGTALVGMLDAFMDNKGITNPENFTEFCNDVVPLFVTDKFCYTNDESLQGKIEVANYSANAFPNQIVKWELKVKDRLISNGEIKKSIQQGSLVEITDISVPLTRILTPSKAEFSISTSGTNYRNHYSVWIYPKSGAVKISSGVDVTQILDEAATAKLKGGGSVLLFMDPKSIEQNSVGGLFTTDYWNYRMFKGISESIKMPVSPGTMGLLMNPDHPAFDLFPTDFHSDWQWWPIVKNSRPMILDSLGNNYLPIIQVVDNIERNHKLGLIFEFKVETGKLLVCTSNLPAIQQYPEAKQLYLSILHYMDSEKFMPASNLTIPGLQKLLSQKVVQRNMNEIKNISY